MFSREVTWEIRRGSASLIRRREDSGVVMTSPIDNERLIASDHFGLLKGQIEKNPDEIRARLERASEFHLDTVLGAATGQMPTAQVRLLSSARYASREGKEWFQRRAILTVTIPYAGERLSVACSPDHLILTCRRLSYLAESEPQRDFGNAGPLPMVWNEGSGALLLHEAIGHASELEASPLRWPDWLQVFDDPLGKGIGSLIADDCGREIESRELTRGEQPSALRRESFRDVPMLRMTNLRVEGSGFPMDFPHRHVEIFLGGHGTYDRLTDQITLRILVADLVHDSRRTRLRPFTLHLARTTLPRAILGASGETIEYPGVICSDEGQRLPVGSSSPTLLTDALGS